MDLKLDQIIRDEIEQFCFDSLKVFLLFLLKYSHLVFQNFQNFY